MENNIANTVPKLRLRLIRIAWASLGTALLTWLLSPMVFCACSHPVPLWFILLGFLSLLFGFFSVIWVFKYRQAIKDIGYFASIPIICITLAGVFLGGAATITAINRNIQGQEMLSGTTSCLSNLKQLGTAINMYCQDNDNHFPLPNAWNNATIIYVKNLKIYSCPAAENRDIPSYAMNSLLKGLSADDIAMPDKTVLLFESVQGKNLSGGPELLPEKPRHKKGLNILFADGHARQIPESKLNTLNWWPKYNVPVYDPPVEERHGK